MMRFVEDFIKEEPSVDQITRIGMDTSKRFFQLHGVDAEGRPALRRQLTRAQVLPFFEKLAPTLVAMEACGAAHHWARTLTRLGHEVRLIAPQLAKPYVARGKNDAADAAALCEAASRPHMRFVPAKSTDEQAALMLAGQRERLVAPAHAARQCDPRPWGGVRPHRRQGTGGDRPAARAPGGGRHPGVGGRALRRARTGACRALRADRGARSAAARLA